MRIGRPSLLLSLAFALGLTAVGCKGEVPADSDGDTWLDLSDCGPDDPLVHPNGEERCGNDLDDDCDGSVDEDDAADATLYYVDGDDDGFGDPTTALARCADPGEGFSELNTDCDDSDAEISPDSAWYADRDHDGFGAGDAVRSCAPYSEEDAVPYVRQGGDCDDDRPQVSPTAVESCNTLDDDCDGLADEEVTTRYYVDADGDEHGDPLSYEDACFRPEGSVLVGDDCDDTDALIYPDAPRICNDGIDNACDGAPAEWLSCSAASASATVTYLGGAAFEYAGSAVSDVGDIDGDGVDELLIGATERASDPESTAEGGAWLVWSDPDAEGLLELGDAAGPRSLLFEGVEAGDKAGVDVTSAGDMNDDGYPDLVVTAYAYDSPATASHTAAGGVFIFSGFDLLNDSGSGPTGLTGTLNLSTANAVYYGGFQADWLGEDAAGAGDLNDDGFDDLIVGARGRASGSDSSAGAILIIHGGAALEGGGNVNTLGGALSGAILEGEADSDHEKLLIGSTMAGAADFNGDGLGDIAVGSWKHQGERGGVYVVTHTVSGTESLADSDFFFDGPGADTLCGWVVRAYEGPAGVSNLVVSCPHYDADGAGAVLVIAGSTELDSAGRAQSLADADSVYVGAEPGDGMGWGMDVGGDVNGDGEADLLVGATGDTSGFYGQVRIFYGPLTDPDGGLLTVAAEEAAVVLESTDILSLFGAELAFVGSRGGAGDAVAIGASQFDSVTGEGTVVDRGAVHLWSGFTQP